MTRILDQRFVLLDPLDKKIITIDGEGREIAVLQDGLEKFPDGVVIDHKNGQIYGTLMGEVDLAGDSSAYGFDGEIWRMAMDGSNPVRLVGDGAIRTPKQITADFEAGKLYWCDREGMRVMRCDLDGGELETLYRAGRYPEQEREQARWCVGIAIDPVGRRLYWTQKGAPDAGQGRICRASLDMPAGADADSRDDVEVLFENLPEPIDLDLDLKNGFLYWTDRGDLEGGNSVCRAEVSADGVVSSTHEVILSNIGETIGAVIEPEEGYIFASSLGGELHRARLDGADLTLLKRFKGLTGIARFK